VRDLLSRLNAWERAHWREIEWALVATLALVMVGLMVAEWMARF
jgi:hypothetical protein